MSPRAKAGAGGFTLLEMMAVVLLTASVLIFAVNIYLQMARASTDAADRTQLERRTVLVLDRLARDLEGATLLVRPDDVDPLAWPWLFLAESGFAADGADRLKLDTRRFLPPASEDDVGDLGVVAWWVEPRDDEGYRLLRQRSPGLPESLDRAFPRADDPGVQVVADDVAWFGVRLLDEEGSWHDRWDSSTLAWSNQLPQGAEIVLALLPHDPETPLEDAPQRARRVHIPLRPLDLQALAEAAREGDGEGDEDEDEQAAEDGECVTVAECRLRNPDAFELFLSGRADRAAAEAVLESLGGQCFSDHAASLGLAVQGCE